MLLSCCDLFSEGLCEKTLEFLYGVIKDKAKHLKKWKGTAKTATSHYTKSVWPKVTTKLRTTAICDGQTKKKSKSFHAE